MYKLYACLQATTTVQQILQVAVIKAVAICNIKTIWDRKWCTQNEHCCPWLLVSFFAVDFVTVYPWVLISDLVYEFDLY